MTQTCVFSILIELHKRLIAQIKGKETENTFSSHEIFDKVTPEQDISV